MRRPKILIGWTEYVSFPEWEVTKVRAKIDTGARSSALHVENIEVLNSRFVAFDIVRNRKSKRGHMRVKARLSRTGRVRSSSGHSDQRIFVKTKIRLGTVEKEIEISLSDRGSMIYRVLLGRTALSGPFLIDVDKRMLLGNPQATEEPRAARRKSSTASPAKSGRKLPKRTKRRVQ